VIYGIGVDIVEVARFRRSLERFGERLARRILTEGEYEDYLSSRRPANFLALRFAAKEALSKALGTGFRDGVGPTRIAVSHNRKGKPSLECSGAVAEHFERHGIVASHVSLSDEADYAIAYVVLERESGVGA
jgi:holo-[acyl-carrier protein] synthase